MTKWIGIVALVGVASSACASAPPARAFSDVPRRLKEGSRIQVTETTGVTTVGRVVALTPSSMTIDADHIRVELPAERVVRIERTRRPILGGALTGLGVGVVLGVSAGAGDGAGGPIDPIAAGASVVAGMLVGTIAGAVIGAVIPVRETIYAGTPPTGPHDDPTPVDRPR